MFTPKTSFLAPAQQQQVVTQRAPGGGVGANTHPDHVKMLPNNSQQTSRTYTTSGTLASSAFAPGPAQPPLSNNNANPLLRGNTPNYATRTQRQTTPQQTFSLFPNAASSGKSSKAANAPYGERSMPSKSLFSTHQRFG
ncbi:unnamed protein product [Amoebophrya sp. A120]|nr:unnamed protein product [Amoebophrya sp. A120]|eukprot:GSA120T00022501001.1